MNQFSGPHLVTPLRSAGTLSSQVAAHVRTEILTARLKPGEKIKIATLMEQLNVGLSAVREGLSRLVAEGFVEGRDQKGFYVSSVSIRDLRDITQARIHIESLVLRRSIELGDVKWEANIVAAFHALSRTPYLDDTGDGAVANDAWWERHSEFHFALLAACDSPWLLKFRETLFDQSERYRRLTVGATAHDRDLEQEHEEIMQAVLSRNPDLATSLLTGHFLRTASVLVEQAGAEIASHASASRSA